jgi:hypothetical protein
MNMKGNYYQRKLNQNQNVINKSKIKIENITG